MKNCEAYYASDSIHCPRCRMTWDANDPEPPVCKAEEEVGNQRLKEIRDFLGDPNEDSNEGGNTPANGRAGGAAGDAVHAQYSGNNMKDQIRRAIESGDPSKMLEMLEWIYATQVVLPATFQPAHAARNLYEASHETRR